MLLNLNQIAQIGLLVMDTLLGSLLGEGDRPAEALPFRRLELSFFECAGVRLFLDKVKDPAKFSSGALISP